MVDVGTAEETVSVAATAVVEPSRRAKDAGKGIEDSKAAGARRCQSIGNEGRDTPPKGNERAGFSDARYFKGGTEN